MSTATSLTAELRALATAVGVLEPNGELNDDFFAHPLDTLGDVIRVKERRQALLAALPALVPPVDEPALLSMNGETGLRRRAYALLTGVERGQLYLTVELRDEAAHYDVVIGLAGEVEGAGGAGLAIELPLIKARDDALTALAGTADGPLSVDLRLNLDDGATASVEGLVSVDGGRLVVRLSGVEDLPDLVIDTDELGRDATTLVVTLLTVLLQRVAATADPELRALVDHLPGVLGFDPGLPVLPLIELVERPGAFRDWLAGLDEAALRAWATHITGLLGLDVTQPAGGPYRIPVFAGPPAVELTLAKGATAVGVPALLVGLAATAQQLSLRATLLELPLGGADPPRVLPVAQLDVHTPAPGPLVDANGVRVGALRAGLAWDGTTLAPALELQDVKLPGVTQPFALLDLTSADTLASTATAIIESALKDVLGQTGPLLTLLGLDPAAGHQVDLVDLATRPLAALAAYHRAAFARPEGWKPQLAALARALGLDAPAVTGAGTADAPWSVALSDDVSLVAWDATPTGTTRSLRLGVNAAIAGEGFNAGARAELLAVDLPASGPTATRMLGPLSLHASADALPDLQPLAADALTVALAWAPGTPLAVTAALEHVSVALDDQTVTLGDLDFPGAFDTSKPDFGLGSAAAQLWPALRLLLARLGATFAGGLGGTLAGVLGFAPADGLPADFPQLELPDPNNLRSLLDDPQALLRGWLAQLAKSSAVSSDGLPHVVHALAAATGAEEVEGAGTPDAPWQVPLQGIRPRVTGHVWLEPDGPPAGWPAAAATALDGTLEDALAATAHHLDSDDFVGREPDVIAQSIAALGEWLDGGDGLVPAAAALPPGWRHGTPVTAAHHRIAAAAAAQVTAEIALRATGVSATLLLAPSFLGDGVWDALTPDATVDLDVANAVPELVDLTAIPAANRYAVRLRDDGGADLDAQLAHVADRVRELKPGAKLVLVAASTAGAAAARYAAAHQDIVLGLVTLGSPLAEAPLAPFTNAALADAVRVLRSLAPSLGKPALDAALAFLHDALDALIALPQFTGDEPPALGSVPALAINGVLETPLADAARQALTTALTAVTRRPPTHAVAALESALRVPGKPGPISVAVDGRLELGRVALDGAAAPEAATLRVRARVVKPNGWLLEDTDARVRWADLELEHAPDSGTRFHARLHDALLHGTRSAVADLDDPLGAQLLARLVTELGAQAEGNPQLRSLLGTLEDLKIIAAGAPAADAFAQLQTDPDAWLAPRMPALLDAPRGLLGFQRDEGAADGRGPWTYSLAPLPLELTVTPEPWTVALKTRDAVLWPDVAWADAEAAFPLHGKPRKDVELHLGPAVVRYDGHATVDLDTPVPILLASAVLSRVFDGAIGAPVRDLHKLLHDPGAYLHAQDAAQALAGLGALAGLTVEDDGTVELPGAFKLRASGALDLELAGRPEGLDVALGLHVDERRGAVPSGHMGLSVDLPGSWGSLTLTTALDASGVRVSVKPQGGAEIELVPRFAGLGAFVDDTVERLLPQALDALTGELPASPLKTDALAVAQALGLYGTSFADAPVALRHLTLQTLTDKAAATAPKLAALLDHLLDVPISATASSVTVGGALTVDLAGQAVELALADLALGPVHGGLDVRWAGAFSGSVAFDVDLTGAVGFPLKPRFEAGLNPFKITFKPAAGSEIVLAPEPDVTITPELALALVAPLGVSLLVEETRAQLAKPLWSGGKSSAQLLRAAGILDATDQLRAPLPDPLAMLAGLVAEIAAELELPLGLDDVKLALVGQDKLGVRLEGGVTIPIGDLESRLLFGDGLGLTILERNGSSWEVHPRLLLDRAGAGISGAGGEVLLDTDVVRVGALEARVSTEFDLQGDQLTVSPWRTELDLAGLGLPILGGGAANNPVAKSMLDNAAAGGEGDPVNPPLDLALSYDGELDIAIAGAAPGRPRWTKIQRGFGPLYIDQVGVESGEDAGLDFVEVLVDGSVSLAGMSLSAQGLGLRVPPKFIGQPSHWSAELDGLALAYQQSMLSIQGGLQKAQSTLNGQPFIDYRGALQVTAAGRSFSAVGAYSRPSDAVGAFTSLFAFVVVNAPLGGPPFLFVTGLAGGAGYNRQLLVPSDPARVPSFPLIQAMRGDFGNDPMQALERLGDAMPPRRGSLWVAAGVKFTTFELLKSTALLYVALDRGVEVGLLGLMGAALPSPDKAIASLELALAARYSTVDQVLSIRAQLTDNSWLLSQDCQLTGGFAFVTWFRESRTVLTVGGYHPSFPVPADFPRVPRVGYHWAVGGGIVIKGESYFALTTSAAMAGNRMEVSYNVNPIRVWFKASLDVLARFKPFSFVLDAQVSIGAEFRLRVCFFACVTIKVSVELGATLHLEGPPLRGFVKVDLAIASVKIPFGPQTALPTYQSWAAFRDTFLVGAARPFATAALPVAGVAATGAEAATPDGSDAKPFRVLPEFALATDSKLPATQWRFGSGAAINGAGVASSFLLAPMGPTPGLAPLHTVQLEMLVGTAWQPVPAGPADQLIVTPVAGKVSKSVFIPAPGTLGPPEANAPMVPAVSGVRVEARSAVFPQAPLLEVPFAQLVDDSDALPLPAFGAVPPPVVVVVPPDDGPVDVPPAGHDEDSLRLIADVITGTGSAVPRMSAGAAGRGLERRAAPQANGGVRRVGREDAPPPRAAGHGGLRAGETQLWRMPSRGGRVRLSGDAAARVVCLNGAGYVLSDHEGDTQRVISVPAGTSHVAISGLGAGAGDGRGAVARARGTGAARPATGWQLHSTLLQVAPSTLLATGAVVLLPAPNPLAADGEPIGAHAIAAALPGMATELPPGCETIAVQVDRARRDTPFDGFAVTVQGARLGAPVRVESAGRLTLLYAVRDADGDRVTVSVASGEGLTPAGVVGLAGPPQQWAAALHARPRLVLVGEAATAGAPELHVEIEAVA